MKKSPINHLHLPVGEVISGRILPRSNHEFMPLVGWTAVREKIHTPLIMIRGALLQEEGYSALVQLELPIYDHTRQATLWLLESLGWKGRLWKAHIPDDADMEAVEDFAGMLSEMGIDDSLYFEDPRTAELLIERSSGPFLLPKIAPPEGFAVHYEAELDGLIASMEKVPVN